MQGYDERENEQLQDQAGGLIDRSSFDAGIRVSTERQRRTELFFKPVWVDWRPALGHHEVVMAQPDFDGVRRAWFDDGRDAGRTMRTSWHPHQGVVVLSFWQGPVCTGSFRLPIEDAPRLIKELVEALGSAVKARPSVEAAAPDRSKLADWWRRWRQRLGSEMAEIINLADRRRG